MRLSVLDQSTVVSGRSPDMSIRESLALAQHCEALGYARYWCAEHHNSASIAGSATTELPGTSSLSSRASSATAAARGWPRWRAETRKLFPRSSAETCFFFHFFFIIIREDEEEVEFFFFLIFSVSIDR